VALQNDRFSPRNWYMQYDLVLVSLHQHTAKSNYENLVA